jgi:hypothetical protein
MPKISMLVAALVLIGIGAWAVTGNERVAASTPTTPARIDVPAGAQINPLQIMMGARHLPVAHYDDYSLVFN